MQAVEEKVKMSVSEIIKEMQRLSAADRLKIIRAASALNKPKRASGNVRSKPKKKRAEDTVLWKAFGIAKAGSITNEEIDRELYG
jgi:predicted metallopeptidase